MKLISKLALASAVFVLAFVSAADAQTMRVSVPFEFHAGGKALPAGEYKVELNQLGQRIQLYPSDGGAGCFIPVKAYTGLGAPDRGTLVFNQYGDKYFLALVNAPGVTKGAAVITGRVERQIAKNEGGAKPVMVRSSGL